MDSNPPDPLLENFNNSEISNLTNKTSLLESSVNESNSAVKKELDTKKHKKSHRSNSSVTFANITDISFAKNYLTFTQLSKGLASFKNASLYIFENISKQMGQKEYNYAFPQITPPRPLGQGGIGWADWGVKLPSQ